MTPSSSHGIAHVHPAQRGVAHHQFHLHQCNACTAAIISATATMPSEIEAKTSGLADEFISHYLGITPLHSKEVNTLLCSRDINLPSGTPFPHGRSCIALLSTSTGQHVQRSYCTLSSHHVNEALPARRYSLQPWSTVANVSVSREKGEIRGSPTFRLEKPYAGAPTSARKRGTLAALHIKVWRTCRRPLTDRPAQSRMWRCNPGEAQQCASRRPQPA